jgi:putative colanic acid biosynthesis UDP-glucose lipid carrier transferase
MESEVHGFLAPEPNLELGKKTHVCGLPVLGSPADLDCLIAEHAISHVILLDNPGSPGFDHRLIQVVHDQGARLLVLSDIDEAFHHRVSIVDEDGLKFFRFYREPLESPINRTLKRTLDLAVSIPVLIFILPPMCALVWILQRRQSPGPLFYAHSRAGIQNRAFTLFKFRTMHAGNPDEARAATRDDGRVFKAGRWLRRLSLDELPQFINVLRGEMSVVGPRPHLVEHNDQFARVMNNYHIRAFVKPGVTGLAQVRGFRGETKTADDIALRLQSDMVYLENWSLMIDCAIILRTVWQMFFPPPTAY